MSMDRIAYYLHRLQGRRGVEKTLAEAAVETITLQEAEVAYAPKALFLEGQYDLVTGVAEGNNTLQSEWLRVNERKSVSHRPLLQHRYKDAFVFSTGFLLKDAVMARSGRYPNKTVLTALIKELDHAAYTMPATGMRYFGHWLKDACAAHVLPDEDVPIIMPIHKEWPNTAQYADIFELRREKEELFRVRDLIYYEDFGMGSSKRARWAKLRAQLRTKYQPAPAKKVYLMRGILGNKRNLVNEDEVINLLSKHGFLIISPEKMTADEILSQTMDAEIVVGMEGSQLSHSTFFMKEGGYLVAIQPSRRFHASYHDYSIAIGCKYGFVVAPAEGDEFRVNTDDLLRTIDLGA